MSLNSDRATCCCARARRRQPVELRQVVVEDGEIEGLGIEVVQGDPAVGRDRDPMAAIFQKRLQDRAEDRVVVGNQYSGGHPSTILTINCVPHLW